MKNTTTNFTTLLTAIGLLVCLSGCQKKEETLPEENGLHKLGDLIVSLVYEIKSNATVKQIDDLKSLIQTTIKTELQKNPDALNAENKFGLTPAHQLIFKLFFLTRAERFVSGSLPNPPLTKALFAFALDKLRTDKKVLGRTIKDKQLLSEYLTTLGITKTPMTAGEFLNAIVTRVYGGWEDMQALKLA